MPSNIQSSLSKVLSSVEAGVTASKHISQQKTANEKKELGENIRIEATKSQIATNKAEQALKEALTARIQAMTKAEQQKAKLQRSIQRQKLKQQKILTEQMKGEK